MLGTGSRKTKQVVSLHTSVCSPSSLLSFCQNSAASCTYHFISIQALWQPCTGQGASTGSKTCFLTVFQPLIPWMTVCLKSSSRSLGKKQSIRSQVISQRSEYPVRESALWNIPAVSITSSIFFRDSGMASSCNQRTLQDTENGHTARNKSSKQLMCCLGNRGQGETPWNKMFLEGLKGQKATTNQATVQV